MAKWIVVLTLAMFMFSLTPTYAANNLSVELDTQFLNTSLELDGTELFDGDGNAQLLRAVYQFNNNWSIGLDYTWAGTDDEFGLRGIFQSQYDLPTISTDGTSNLLTAQVQYDHAFSNQFSLGLQAGYKYFDLESELILNLADLEMDGFFVGVKAGYAFNQWFGLEASYGLMVNPSADVSVIDIIPVPATDEYFRELDVAASYALNSSNSIKLGYRAVYTGFNVEGLDLDVDYKMDGFYLGLQHKF